MCSLKSSQTGNAVKYIQYCKCQPYLYPRSLTVVNILGSQKCALSLHVPRTWFNNWPYDDSLSRNMSPHL